MSGAKRYREVERKFDVDAATLAPSFDDVVGVIRVEHAPSQTLDAVYYDTADRDLAAHRITLRRRTGGLDSGWHLKLPAGTDARTELRMPLDDAAHHDVPGELLEVVSAVISNRRVVPVARISTSRRVRLLHGDDDVVLAEFCDDQVVAGLGADGSSAQQRWREWELELVDAPGGAELMDRLSQRMVEAGARPAAVGSKLARVLGTSPSC